MGLSETWVERLVAARPHSRMVMSVRRLTAGTPAAALLKEGDLLLTAGGTVLSSFHDVAASEMHADTVALVRRVPVRARASVSL